MKRVYSGSHPQTLAIVVNHSQEVDEVITWDVKKDEELEAFTTVQDAVVLWDSKGWPYITQENQVVLVKQGVRMNCFEVGELNEMHHGKKSLQNIKFGYHKGHRFDAKHHEWLYMRDYLCLSYSYMTFVMKYKFQLDDSGEDQSYNEVKFDQEMYNYILKNQTAFTEDPELMLDHEKLGSILKSLEAIDISYIEQIQYYYESTNRDFNQLILGQAAENEKELAGADDDMLDAADNDAAEADADEEEKPLESGGAAAGPDVPVAVTPLRIAYAKKNFRSVKILLTTMAKIDFNASSTFKDILPDLVNYKGFIDYMWNLPFATTQMKTKQSLRVESPD